MKKLFSILFATVLAVSLCLVPAVASANTYDSSLTLENKDANWDIISDGISGTLDYNASGSTFDFSFSATGLTASIDYDLIYYADTEDRFVDWGGDNPGALIDTFTTDGTGAISATTGSVELNMNLPSPPDANAYFYDYTGDPDYYAHATGAKIWLVPSTCYTAPEVTTWAPGSFLFETDLIWYDDTDVPDTSTVGLTVGVPDIVAISATPTSIDFGTLYPGETSATFDITVENVGTHEVDVDADVYEAGLFYDNLQLNIGTGWYIWSYWTNIITNLAMGDSELLYTRLPVPGNYIPTGTETATLIFEATASP